MTSNRRRAAGIAFSAALSLAGWGFVAGPAHADGPRTWCPGDDPRGGPGGPFVTSPPTWDWNVCHTFYIVPAGQGNVSPGIWADSPPPGGVPAPAPCGRDLFTGLPLNC